jgi:hypothetical protein
MPYHFHGQRSKESVRMMGKQHPFVLLHPLVGSVCILLAPFLVYMVSGNNSVLGWVVLLAVSLGMLHAGLAWYSWQNTVFLLTSERIVLLHQKGVLHREFSECDLSSIQQVSHEVHGLYHTLFGYGNIAIYTGGAQLAFLIPNICDPYDTQQEILRIKNKEQFSEEEEMEADQDLTQREPENPLTKEFYEED